MADDASQPGAPPSYAEARRAPKVVPRPDIPVEGRRSMEDLMRELPPGWIRQFDPNSCHQFFVDTKAQPPKSTWVHPLDDDDFLNAHPEWKSHPHARPKLDAAQRERDEEDEALSADSHATASRPSASAAAAKKASDAAGVDHSARHADATYGGAGASSSAAAGPSTSTYAAAPPPTGLKKLGRSMKDKLTGTTYEERQRRKAQRKEEERRMMETQQLIQRSLLAAVRTGQPQHIGRDRQGRDLWAQPPPPGIYGAGPALGHTPWQDPALYAGGIYGAPYGPYRRGYGGGGMAAPMLLGAGTGMLLGGLLF